jgi:uncharacterized Zn-binding protein involved in type VI secretion
MTKPAARLGDLVLQDGPHCHAPIHPAAPVTAPCSLPSCVPAGPGMIALGSGTVLIGGLPAARMGDMTAHTSCVAPIPMPTGKVLPPCCPNVLIGG